MALLKQSTIYSTLRYYSWKYFKNVSKGLISNLIKPNIPLPDKTRYRNLATSQNLLVQANFS
ncbi:hypothetical protein ALT717_10393 [Alteromonas macleodii]